MQIQIKNNWIIFATIIFNHNFQYEIKMKPFSLDHDTPNHFCYPSLKLIVHIAVATESSSEKSEVENFVTSHKQLNSLKKYSLEKKT